MDATNFYIEEVKSRFGKHKHAGNAAAMSAYMKHHFAFLGIKKPEREKLTKELNRDFVKYHSEEVLNACEILWQQHEREFQMVALELLILYKKQLKIEDIDVIEKLILQKSWWDSVDLLASHILGAYFLKYPEMIESKIDKYRNDENIWLVRTAILFQLKYKSQTNTALLRSLIEQYAHQKEFFIAKAIGWALREYAKTDAVFVKRITEEISLQSLSKREALKHLGK